MYDLNEFYSLLCKIAPMELSLKQIERGAYDNSGILVRQTDKIKKCLFCLDLVSSAVNKAIRSGCDTVVTHHPTIYSPVKALDCHGENAALLSAIRHGLNVISMHLNLDAAFGGTDECFARALGAKSYKIIDLIDGVHGYGREFEIEKTAFASYVAFAKKALSTKSIIAYGNRNAKITRVASFCGGGGSAALAAVKNGSTKADLIVSADLPHHVVLELLERGKLVMQTTHYAAEIAGVKAFAVNSEKATSGHVKTEIFLNKRFR